MNKNAKFYGKVAYNFSVALTVSFVLGVAAQLLSAVIVNKVTFKE